MEPYEGREPYIFISYARKDAERVAPYLDALSGAGYRVWYDKGIKAGDDWLKTLLEKVRDCEIFCPLFSKAFSASDYCEKETNYAIRKKKTIVPLYLEEVTQEDNWLFDFLGDRQNLRMYDCNPAQFAERLEGQEAFAPCKAPPEWNKVGQIQWRLSADGVLSIAKNEEYWRKVGGIPMFQHEPRGGSTAPWMPYREKVVAVEIADNIGIIGILAFYQCESLINVHIGDSVAEISNRAFLSCKRLTDVHIPSSVTRIGELAFYGCDNLNSVEIPAGAEVGQYAFPDHTHIIRRDAP